MGVCSHPFPQNVTATVEGLFPVTLGGGGLPHDQSGTEFMRFLPTNRAREAVGRTPVRTERGRGRQQSGTAGTCESARAALLLRAGESALRQRLLSSSRAHHPRPRCAPGRFFHLLWGPQKATPRPPPSPFPSGPRSALWKATSGSARPLTWGDCSVSVRPSRLPRGLGTARQSADRKGRAATNQQTAY